MFTYFTRRFLNVQWSDVLIVLFCCYMAFATWNCCSLDACSVYTMQPCTSLQCHFIRSHIRKMHVCLTVTFHLHFWQNDRDLLRAAAVRRGWNSYQNESRHGKLTMEKKTIPPHLPGIEPATFRSRVRRCTTELSPLCMDRVPAHLGLLDWCIF